MPAPNPETDSTYPVLYNAWKVTVIDDNGIYQITETIAATSYQQGHSDTVIWPNHADVPVCTSPRQCLGQVSFIQ